MRILITLLLVALLVPPGVLGAVSATVGDRIELKATNSAGVPLHKAPRGTHDFQRVPDGATATVVETARNGHWLKITLADGRSGWIIEKYVARVLATAPSPPTPPAPGTLERPPAPEDPERVVWGSSEGCTQVVRAGGRMAPEDPTVLRLGTWNIRWFPRGCSPSEQCPEQATDIPWLACTIAWMHVDLLAIQEILETPAAQEAMSRLLTALNQLTGGSWQVNLQDCGAASTQQVGFLWDSTRITLEDLADAWELNGASSSPTGSACAGNLRPGRYAYATTANGADFHVLSVHFDSGRQQRDYQHRRRAARRLGTIQINGTSLLARDQDVVVLGDYNTMGREEAPPISAAEELATFDQDLASGFHRLPMTPHCTEYFGQQPGALETISWSVRGCRKWAPRRVSGVLCGQAVCRHHRHDAGSARSPVRSLPGRV